MYLSKFVNCSSLKDIGACFVGIVLPYILQYKGLIPMHSSGLVFNNKSFGLIAGPGVGKSTAQVIFLNKGFNFLTDDVLPLTLKRHQVLAYPGYPALKLDPKSISKGKFIKKGTLLTELSSKYICTLEEKRICKTPTILGGLFYLCPKKEEGTEITITKVTGQEKLIILLTNVFTLSIINDNNHIRYLELFSSSAFSKVPLYKVEYHRTIDQLNEVIEKIINIIRKQQEM
ncbi:MULTISPECIES: hypothetical protein [Lysinibacillus]|uniref:hypothetical protein n=1 Tax=Lysinibacillus TaxID=400634 RepID=UPI0025800703|nr:MULTISPECIES: hypothetical protein [Lysinibacillus]